MATKTIGLTGRDFTSLAGWISYLQTLGSFSADEIGECYKDSGPITHSATADFSGITTNGFTIQLRAAAGESHANTTNTALRYDEANGVSLRFDVAGSVDGITGNAVNLCITNLQISKNSDYASVIKTATTTVNWKANGCIFYHPGAGQTTGLQNSFKEINDCLIILNTTADSGGTRGIDFQYTTNPIMRNTLIQKNTPAVSSAIGVSNLYTGTLTLISCYISGFAYALWLPVGQAANVMYSADSKNWSIFQTGTPTYTNALSNVNTSLQFTSTSAPFDFRTNASSSLINAGDPNNSYPVDIYGTSRGVSSDIGPYEFGSVISFLRKKPIITTMGFGL